jgi:hypothetical protein
LFGIRAFDLLFAHQFARAAGPGPRMAMMCVTSLATASKECQIGAKSCKAGEVT